MKKIFLASICILFLSSCFNKNIEEKMETTSGSETLNENIIKYDGIEIDTSSGNIEKERNDITLDDIETLSLKENTENKLLLAGKKFKENLEKTKENDLTKKIDGGISFKNLENETKKIPKELKRDFSLNLNIFDYKTQKIIENGSIYLNGIKLGDFQNGNFTKDFSWITGIESFSIMVRSENYGDAFIKINSLNSDGSYLGGDVYMKPLDISRTINLDKEVTLEDNNLKLKIPKCSLIDNSGECYKGEIKTKISFISADDVNNGILSLNMKALTKEGKVVYLQSGGMAFTDFITPNGDILQVKNRKNIEITYKVDKKTIEDMENTLYGQGEKNGYWIYDKNQNIWLEKEANIKLDKKNNTWTAIVSEIY